MRSTRRLSSQSLMFVAQEPMRTRSFARSAGIPAKELVGNNHRILKSRMHSREFFHEIVPVPGEWRPFGVARCVTSPKEAVRCTGSTQ